MLRPINDEYGGFEWSPTEMSSPHEFDFKTLLVDPDARDRVIESIAQEWSEPGSSAWQMRLADFTPPNVDYRKYSANSSNKRGFFIQAGCVITDGFNQRGFSHLLVVDRSKAAFHDNRQQRYLSGLSCVVGTPLASTRKLDNFGHVPAVIFNDIRAYCPWAIFSRKLLIPDVYVESRFLGAGFNFQNIDRRYLSLIWHVRLKNLPEVMFVDARRRTGDAEHDRTTWIPFSRLPELQLLPIDHGALKALIDDDLRPQGSQSAGYVPVHAFESVLRSRWRYENVRRDEIILDLLHIIQRDLHSGRQMLHPNATGRREEAFHVFVAQQLRDLTRAFQIDCEIILKPHLGWGTGQGEPDLSVTINDADRNRLFRYLVELKVDEVVSERSEYRNQAERYRSAAMSPTAAAGGAGPTDAIVLVQEIWPRTADASEKIDVVALEADITIPYEHMPVHIIRMHLAPPTPSKGRAMKEIAHGLVPVAQNGRIAGLLFVRSPNDPGFQPLGGKVEGLESPDLALHRELEEETVEFGEDRILASDFAEAVPLFPGSDGKPAGLTLMMKSRKSGEMTNYRFHPFLVLLTDAARRRVGRRLSQPLRSLRVVSIADWVAGADGYDPMYAMAVEPMLSEEKLWAAAVEIPKSLD